MWLRLRAAFRKEFTQFFRSRILIGLVIWLFIDIVNDGIAMSIDVQHLPFLVIDHDQTSVSRGLSERFRIAPYFSYRRAAGDLDPDRAIDTGSALVLVIPAGFARSLDRGEPASVQLVADGAYSNISLLAMGYASEIVAGYNADSRVEWLARRGGSGVQPGVEPRVLVWYLPGLNETHSLVVAMVAIVTLLVGSLLPASAIVREKEAGTLEQLLVTPLQPWEIVAAKLAPMTPVMVGGLLLGLAEALWLFGAPFRGSFVLFFALSGLMLFASMGLGACIGAVTQNLQQTLLLNFALLFPMFFLSGTFVPIDNMPEPMQWLSYISPLRYYLPIAKGILFKGVGLEVLLANTLGLGLYGVAAMLLGARLLRRNLLA